MGNFKHVFFFDISNHSFSEVCSMILTLNIYDTGLAVCIYIYLYLYIYIFR